MGAAEQVKQPHANGGIPLGTQLHAFVCHALMQVPICLVSLVEDDRQWFKSNQGGGLPTEVTETDRKSSFCAWTLLPHCPTVLVVENALEDARFSKNSLVVGFPHIRFYAGLRLSSLTCTFGLHVGIIHLSTTNRPYLPIPAYLQRTDRTYPYLPI